MPQTWSATHASSRLFVGKNQIPSPISQRSSKKIVNCGLCVVCWFVQGGNVMFLVNKSVLNYIKEDLEPAFHRNGTFFKLKCNG